MNSLSPKSKKKSMTPTVRKEITLLTSSETKNCVWGKACLPIFGIRGVLKVRVEQLRTTPFRIYLQYKIKMFCHGENHFWKRDLLPQLHPHTSAINPSPAGPTSRHILKEAISSHVMLSPLGPCICASSSWQTSSAQTKKTKHTNDSMFESVFHNLKFENLEKKVRTFNLKDIIWVYRGCYLVYPPRTATRLTKFLDKRIFIHKRASPTIFSHSTGRVR